MRIEFCGADRTVTGSCHLLEIAGKRILLDCGMYQGSRDLARQYNCTLPPDLKSIDAVILSHGHLDHCGKLPMLVRSGYQGPIYVTAASAEVARVVLLDSAQIQEEDASYLNRRQQSAGENASDCIRPLYVRADALETLKRFKRVKCTEPVDLGNGVSFTLFDAGHILGSTYVLLKWTETPTGAAPLPRTLLFTADIGRYNTPILRDPHPVPSPVDFLITESTYGGQTHAPVADIEPQILDAVQFIVKRRSRLLLPAFAVGRTQTLLWYMRKLIAEKKIPPMNVYVDSPMGVEVSKIHSEFRESYDDETLSLIGNSDLFGIASVRFAVSSQQSREINADRGPCVIIASSPACEFGRILHHLKQSVEKPDDLLMFTGFIPGNTLGRKLQDGQKRVRIFDRWYDVRCQVRTIHGLSAHADQNELLRFLTPAIKPGTIAHIVHGEPDRAEAMAARLIESGAKFASVPAMTTSAFG